MKKLIKFAGWIIAAALAASCDNGRLDPDSSGGTEGKEYTDISVQFEQFGGDVADFLVKDGDEIALMFSRDEFPLEPYTQKTINALKNGAQRNIVMVNPAKDGRFLAFDGSSEIVNNMGLIDLPAGEENAQSNLVEIRKMVEDLCDNSDYVFSLEKSNDIFTIRHKESGLSFTDKEEAVGSTAKIIWSDNAGPIEFSDASEVKNKINLVTGTDCQLYVKSEGKILYSGRTNGSYRWYDVNPQMTNGNTNWLIYAIPVKNYEYKATSSGSASASFNGLQYDKKYEHYAIFPYSTKSGLEGGNINFTIPRSKKYVENGIESGTNISVGKLDADSKSVAMQNVCGVLEIPIKGSQRVLSVEITDLSGNSIWGNATIDAKSLEYQDMVGGSSTSSIDCYMLGGVGLDASKATNFMTVMPVMSFKKGLSVRIIAVEGEVVKEFKDVQIKKGQVTKLPQIVLDPKDFAVSTYSIENPIVAEYMTNVNYGAYESTVFSSECHSFFLSDYLDRAVDIIHSKLYRPDFPSDVRVSWSPEAGEESHILLKTIDSSVPVRDTLLPAGENSYQIWNLLPDRHYTYTITSKSGKELQTGEFKTKGTLRMIYAEGSWNIRDMGGMLSREYGNRPVRYEQLYRGGSLNEITPAASQELKTIGIKAELDLRGSVDPQDGQLVGESASLSDWNTCAPGYTMINGADYKQVMTDYTISAKFHTNPPLFCTALVKDIAWIIYELKKDTPHPVYYHCKLGADRTNAVAYSIEGLLGCSIADMGRDYELTSFGYAKTGLINRYVTGNSSFHKSFKAMEVPEGCGSLAQKMYYYFNQHFSDAHISDKDLDWFIEYMLGMSDSEFQQYKGTWSWKTKTWSTTLPDIFNAPTIN